MDIISSCLICDTVVLLQEPLTPVPAHRGPGPGPVVNSVTTTTTGSQSPPSITPIHIHQVSDNSLNSYECDSDNMWLNIPEPFTKLELSKT